jgi:hypothetical protein
MRLARIVPEITALLTALFTALIAAAIVFSIGLVPHTMSNGSEIEAAFLRAQEFVDQSIKATGRIPIKSEFYEWRSGKGQWVSSIELAKYATSNFELRSRFGELPPDTYVLSVWRGEWSEYYVQGKGSTVESALGLYSSAIGLALGACGLSAVLWLFARALKRRNTCAAQ